MSYDSNNIFAKIIKGDIPCERIYEDEYSLAFYDINPQAKIHVLVIPKGEYINYDDFVEKSSYSELQGFFQSLAKVIDLLDVKEDGYRLVTNQGLFGGQEVPHFHMHILAGEQLGRLN